MATAAGVAVANITVAQSLLGEIAESSRSGPARPASSSRSPNSATRAGSCWSSRSATSSSRGGSSPCCRAVRGRPRRAAAAPSFAVLLGAMAVVGALAVVIQVLVALAVAAGPCGERGRAIGAVTERRGRRPRRRADARPAWSATRSGGGPCSPSLRCSTGTLGAVLWRRLRRPGRTGRGYRRLVAGLPDLYRAHRVLRQDARRAGAGDLRHVQRAVDARSPESLPAGPPALATAIGLFGLVGIAGALTARRAGRLADRGHGRVATGSALALMLAALDAIAPWGGRSWPWWPAWSSWSGRPDRARRQPEPGHRRRSRCPQLARGGLHGLLLRAAPSALRVSAPPRRPDGWAGVAVLGAATSGRGPGVLGGVTVGRRCVDVRPGRDRPTGDQCPRVDDAGTSMPSGFGELRLVTPHLGTTMIGWCSSACSP